MHKEKNRQTSVSDKSENYNSVTDGESMHKERNGETSVSEKFENYNSMTDYTLNGDKESVQALTFFKGNLGHLNLSSRSEDRPALSENMRKKCLKLLERYPNGMYASNFPSYFEEVNLLTFDLHSLGYHSLADFIDDLPDIFTRTSIAGSKKDWVIYPASSRDTAAVENVNLSNGSIFHIESIILNTRKILQGYPEGLTLDNFLHVYSINCNEPLYVRDLGFDKLEHFLLSIAERVPLKVETSGNSKTVHFITYDDIPIKPPVSAPAVFEKEALPSDAASPDSKFVLHQLPSDFDYSKYMPVYTSSIFSPDLIYLQIQGTDTTDALSILSEELDSFYRGSLSNSYKMKNAHIKVGAACAALWPGDNHWYRAKIMSIPSMEMVQLFYVDYGTKEVVPVSLLRYIRQKHMKLPAQALKSQLAFLKPKEENWNLAVKRRLLSLCQDVSLMAKIEERSIDGTLSVILCDTNGEQDIYINDILLKEGFAENKSALYPQLGGQAAYGINIPPFQAEGAQHFQRSPYAVVGSPPSTVNDVALSLLQKLTLCYAQNPQLKQQHIQSGFLNPFFNLPSSTMLGNPSPVMNPLLASTGLVGLSPLTPPYTPSAYLVNMSEYPSPPSAELNRQPVKPKFPSSKEMKETKKPSLDDSENDVFDDVDDERFQEFYEKVLSPVRKRLVKRINFGNGYVMHIIVWNSLPYVSSGDISALIWYNKEADYLFRRLQLKEITFPVVDIFEEGNEELFNQLKRYNVKGIQKVTSSKSCVHLYPLSCVIKILNMFGHPSATLRVRIVDEISSFNLSDPIWQEFSESEANENEEVEVPETDDDKISRLCLFDLLAMKEGIRCRRLKMVNKLNGPENYQCVEEIEKLEQLHEKVLERIQEIKEVCELFS
ncbi:uncharacterized protein LOC118192573 isoform X2 [Stegodyphus dumicola]|uniref:uncharacterized protein LOC118192573 isoform X2 n=1 Tax=Stegodyphus dumicola TaxID=202533 RepID=UPI0015A8F0FD|nr:uncharacterized protein LOC118192573 isoform X2 [Stegodyphus dumicola]